MNTRNAASERGRPQFSLRKLLVVLTLAGIALGLWSYRAQRHQFELGRLAELDKNTLAEIVQNAEAIRTQLGRAPKDQDELEEFLGRALPVVHDYGYPTPLNYYRTGKNSFQLSYWLFDTDDWIYDSTAPSAGWVQHWD